MNNGDHWLVFGRPNCLWCEKAMDLLDDQTIEYRSTLVEEHRLQLVDNGFTTVPQIWHNGQYVGGYDDLVKYLNNRRSIV